jgi:hypothetical protein
MQKLLNEWRKYLAEEAPKPGSKAIAKKFRPDAKPTGEGIPLFKKFKQYNKNIVRHYSPEKIKQKIEALGIKIKKLDIERRKLMRKVPYRFKNTEMFFRYMVMFRDTILDRDWIPSEFEKFTEELRNYPVQVDPDDGDVGPAGWLAHMLYMYRQTVKKCESISSSDAEREKKCPLYEIERFIGVCDDLWKLKVDQHWWALHLPIVDRGKHAPEEDEAQAAASAAKKEAAKSKAQDANRKRAAALEKEIESQGAILKKKLATHPQLFDGIGEEFGYYIDVAEMIVLPDDRLDKEGFSNPEFDLEKYKKDARKALKDFIKKVKSHSVWKEPAIDRDPAAKAALERLVGIYGEILTLGMQFVITDEQ